MKQLLVFFTLFMALAATPSFAQQGDDPASVVRRQLTFYNDHNLESFLATHADDAVYYDLKGEVLYEGKPAIREAFGSLFEDYPDLTASIAYRAVIGNKVVDHEYFKPRGEEGPVQQFVVVYTVVDGLIRTVHLIQPTADEGDDAD